MGGGGGWRPLSLPRPLTRSLGSVPTDPRPVLCPAGSRAVSTVSRGCSHPQLGRELAGRASHPRFPGTLGAALSFWPRKILRARRVPPPPNPGPGIRRFSKEPGPSVAVGFGHQAPGSGCPLAAGPSLIGAPCSFLWFDAHLCISDSLPAGGDARGA